jgi:hypothetical protein
MAFSQHGNIKKPAQKSARVGRYSANVLDLGANSVTINMKEKLEKIFTLKRRLILANTLEQMTPLKFLAKSPELRNSLEKVMPEKLVPENMSVGENLSVRLGNSINPESALMDDENEGLKAVITTEALDTKATKSIIRLSNAILPLLSFYTENAPAPKQSASPSRAGKGKTKSSTTSSIATATATVGVSSINVQEVHHAFHAVLKHIRRLESASTASTATEALHGATSTMPQLLEPPPPLVDVMMNVSVVLISLLSTYLSHVLLIC